MEDIEKLGENASEMINKLSKRLERSQDLNSLFIKFVDVDSLPVPNEIKELLREKIAICQADKEA